MNSIFSTDSFHQQQRFRAWREAMNDVFFPISCGLRSDEQCFDGAIEQISVGTGELYGIGSQEISYERKASEIRSCPSNTCQLFLVLDGKVHVSQNDRQVTLGAGHMCLYDTDTPFQLEMPGQYDSLVLVLPRPVLEARFPRLENAMGRLVDGNKGVAQLLAGMLREASKLGSSMEPQTLSRLGGPIAEMAVLALETELCAVPPERVPRRAELLSRLKSKILEQLGNPEIDLHGIASEIGIGGRTMNRLFAVEATTPTQWLWQQRLAACHKALVEGRAVSVTEVAINHGFTNPSHFSRSFKQAFGVQPKSLMQVSVHSKTGLDLIH